MALETEKSRQAKEKKSSHAAREAEHRNRQTVHQMPLMALSQLRAAAAEPEGLLQLPPRQIQMLASALGNGVMSQLLERGPQPSLEDTSLLRLDGTMTATLSPNEIRTAEPMLYSGPGLALPVSELPQPSLCRVSET
mgnify:CR=1 FL=1